jgi:hypothetical protein
MSCQEVKTYEEYTMLIQKPISDGLYFKNYTCWALQISKHASIFGTAHCEEEYEIERPDTTN